MTHTNTRKSGRAVRGMVGSLSIAIALSAVGLVGFALARAAFHSWVLYSFEGVTLVACAMGVLFALGRFANAPALGLACIAGCVAVGALLIFVSLRGQLELNGSGGAMSLKAWVMARVAAAVVLSAIGAMLVLQRDGRSWPLVLRGVLGAVPLALVAGGVFWLRGHAAFGAMPAWLAAILSMTGALVLGVSVCASAHFAVRAFEVGADAGEVTPPTGAKSS